MNKKPLSRTAKYYKKVQISKRQCTNIDIKELIELYKKYECLWNPNSVDYKDKSLKQQAWTRIANRFGKEMVDIKRKVKHLRTAYVVEKKKVDMSKRAGVVPQYQPILYYYNYLNFLDNIVILRKDNNDYEFESVEISQEADDQFLNFTKKEDIELDLPPDQELSPEPSPAPSYSPSPPPSPPQQKQRISTPKIVSTRSFSSRPPIRNSYKEYKPNKTVDAPAVIYNPKSQNSVYTSFGTTIALQLQQLPLEMATETMSEIHLILTRKILEYIKCGQNGQHHPSYSDIEDSDNDLIEVVKEDI